MTTDSPKGPEREARPSEEVSLQERLAQIISFQWGFDEKQFGATNADRIAAAVARVVVEPELERLAAEAQQMRGLLDGWDRYARRTMQQKREWRRRVSEAEAEVSRLREQLAAAVVLPEDWETRVRQLLHRWVDRIAKVRKRNPNTIAEQNGWVYSAENCADEIAGEITVLVMGWIFASSEVEAPPRRHVVRVERRESMFYADCSLCLDGTSSSDEKVVEDWKDQHLADTLRPVLDEGRPSGSGAAAPQAVETFDCKQDCPAVAPECFCVGTEPHRLCCHEDAAQAARSEATPEEDIEPREPRSWTHGDPEPPADVTAVRSPATQVFTRVDVDCWLHHAPHPVKESRWRAGKSGAALRWEELTSRMKSWRLTEVPSPSLRKEGEDRG